MRKSNSLTLKEALNLFLKKYNYEERFYQSRLLVFWERAMGKEIARQTELFMLRNGILTIGLSSAALKNELAYAKKKVMQMLNKEAGKDIIKDIIIK